MRAPKYKVVLTLGKFLFEEVHRYVGEYINPFTVKNLANKYIQVRLRST